MLCILISQGRRIEKYSCKGKDPYKQTLLQVLQQQQQGSSYTFESFDICNLNQFYLNHYYKRLLLILQTPQLSINNSLYIPALASPTNMKKEEVIYVTDDYLSLVRDKFTVPIYAQLLQRIIQENKNALVSEMEEGQILGEQQAKQLKIVSIEPFLKSAVIQHNYGQIFYHDFPAETGIKIQFIGNINNATIIFRILEAFLQRHPISLLQLTPQQVYMFNIYCKSYTGLLFEWFACFFLLIYHKNTLGLMKTLAKTERIIKRNEIAPNTRNGNSYHTICSYQAIFSRFVKAKGVKVYQLEINQNYMRFLSNEEHFSKFCFRLNEFLMSFSILPHEVTLFQDYFQIAIFMSYYAKELQEISLREVPLLNNTKKVMSVHYMTSEQTADHLVEELYYRMHKSYRLIPSGCKPAQLPDKARLVEKPTQAAISSMRQKTHLINEKFKIVIKPYSSIYRNQETVLFLIHQLQKCHEFREVMAENEIQEGRFLEWIRGQRGERYIEYLTYRSKLFNSCIGWYINMENRNKDRVMRDLEYFFNTRFRDIDVIKVVIPVEADDLIDFVLPIFMQKLLELTKFSEQGLIKTVELITSCKEEQRIRENLRKFFHILKHSKYINIRTYYPLDLSTFTIERILEFDYLTMEYYLSNRPQPPNIRRASPINSFVVDHQRTKIQGKRKIIIAIHQDTRFDTEFIINIYMEKVVAVRDSNIAEVGWGQLGIRMRQVVELIKKYCSNMDMLVVYGDQAMNDIECNLYYSQVDSGELQTILTKAEIDFQLNKLTLNRDICYQMRIVYLQTERYLFETHSQCAEEIKKILRNK